MVRFLILATSMVWLSACSNVHLQSKEEFKEGLSNLAKEVGRDQCNDFKDHWQRQDCLEQYDR